MRNWGNTLKLIGECILERLNRIRKEMVTRLNAIGALLALYALPNPVISDKVLGFVPEDHRALAGILLPVFWFWLVQKGKEVDRNRVIEQAKEGKV